MSTLSDVNALNKELDAVLTNQASLHNDMDRYRDFYLHSAFYPSKSGRPRSSVDLSNNLLRVFANMNINFTSKFPVIKVPTTGATEEQRISASLREKLLLSVWRESNGEMLQEKWAADGTVLSTAVAVSGFDLDRRCAFVKRYDPRYCFWQLSEGNDFRVVAFWVVVPITADQVWEEYGIKPTGLGGIGRNSFSTPFLHRIDGKDWHFLAIRLDETHRVAWVGDKLVEEPHRHLMGGIPVDICMPFDDLELSQEPGFYLAPMINMQANLNLTIQRRDNIVDRYAHPVTWGTGVIARQLDDVKQGMRNGGFIGLKQNGQLGILQLSDLRVLNEHEEALRADMLRVSGFSTAAMGELAGANTSGDALGMYFTPTQRHIERQNIRWKAFYQSINAKILRASEKFAKTDETFKISGYSPRGTVKPLVDQPDKVTYYKGGFAEEFDPRAVIDGNYNSVVEFNAVTPKNEIEEKRLVMDMVNTKVLSRTTGFEMIGIDSPEDELALLKQEQAEPVLNPQGMQQIANAANSITGGQASPTPSPVASEIKPNVQPVQ